MSWAMPAAVFCAVAVAQLALVAVAGTDIPFHDQWDAEGAGLYPALRAGTLHPADLLHPHNEHRIFWSRLLAATLFRFNGQWDPLVQLVAGAFLHATGAAALAAFLVRGRSAVSGWLIALSVALAGLPLAGWHNALWGFQSAVYFVLLFSVLAFGLLTNERSSPWQAVAGLLAVVAAMLAMGPGLLVPLVLAAGLGLRWFERRKVGGVRLGRAWPLAILLLAAWWLHQPVPEHAVLWAGSTGEFLAALVRLLAWPYSGQPWAALVLNVPVLVVVAGRLLKRREAAVGEDFAVVLAGWALALVVASAWTRGGGAEFSGGVPSRYVDLVVLLPLCNAWCAAVLVPEAALRWRSNARLVAAAWGVSLFAGWAGLSAEAWRGVIAPRARDRDAPVRLLREFQRTDDAAVFTGQPRLLVPHPNLDSVRAVLRDPRMTGALPPSLQPEQPPGPLSRAVRRLLRRE